MKQHKLTLFWGSALVSLALLTGCATTTTTTSPTTPSSGGGVIDNIQSTVSPSGSSQSSSPLSFITTEEDYAFDWTTEPYTALDLSTGTQTITQSGIYVLSGTLQEGEVTVSVDKATDTGTVYLVLNNAHINSTTGTPLLITQAKKVVVLLAPGTANTLTQGAITTTDTEFPSAALYSKADITITGSGALTVTTAYNDGITSKDDFIITEGTITVTAASDGIVGKDLLAIEAGTIEITAGKDGLKSTNTTDAGKGNIIITGGTFTVDAQGDAIQSEQALQIDGGSLALSSGGGYPGQSIKAVSQRGGARWNDTAESAVLTIDQSGKGLKAETGIIINGGDFYISAFEDALHCTTDITMTGGTMAIQTGDDGFHADNAVAISGGTVVISSSYEGIEGGNAITIDTGTIQVTSDDDGFNVSNNGGILTINGGELSIASRGDALDSNGNLAITGGTLSIDTSTIGQSDSAIDYDGSLTYTGGTIIDQNGATIDPSSGFGGGRMPGTTGGAPGNRPGRTQ